MKCLASKIDHLYRGWRPDSGTGWTAHRAVQGAGSAGGGKPASSRFGQVTGTGRRGGSVSGLSAAAARPGGVSAPGLSRALLTRQPCSLAWAWAGATTGGGGEKPELNCPALSDCDAVVCGVTGRCGGRSVEHRRRATQSCMKNSNTLRRWEKHYG